MKLSEFTHTSIICDQELSHNNWLKFYNAFDNVDRNDFTLSCNNYDYCTIEQTKTDVHYSYCFKFTKKQSLFSKMSFKKKEEKILLIPSDCWNILTNV